MIHKVIFTGYLAELLKLQAEKRKISAADLVISFFDTRCNAPQKRASRCNAPRRATKSRRAAR